jgi:hypothetical protein
MPQELKSPDKEFLKGPGRRGLCAAASGTSTEFGRRVLAAPHDIGASSWRRLTKRQNVRAHSWRRGEIVTLFPTTQVRLRTFRQAERPELASE